jgi:hypothetical protein
LNDLSFDEVVIKKFKISRLDLIAVLSRKFFWGRALRHDWLYYILLFLYSFGIIKRPVLLGTFYRNLWHEDRHLPDLLEYKDSMTGEPIKTTVQELFYVARHLAKDRIEAAWAYYYGELKREEVMKIIKGESLDTGREGVAVKDLKFYYDTSINNRPTGRLFIYVYVYILIIFWSQ